MERPFAGYTLMVDFASELPLIEREPVLFTLITLLTLELPAIASVPFTAMLPVMAASVSVKE
jgi:hypothetical protein